MHVMSAKKCSSTNDRRSHFVVWPITDVDDTFVGKVTQEHEIGDVREDTGSSENAGKKAEGRCPWCSACLHADFARQDGTFPLWMGETNQ
jgi:hypothetical protein